ncbi:MAG: DUF4139 domain-containing protein [Planctomycetes bacterium]|nr:DUF4139 domain-containing protein [Planctomycetota bacterium]
MNQRKYAWLTASVVASLAGVFLGYHYFTSVGQADTTTVAGKPKPAELLPIRQVVLFNSGVGYFQREGEVNGSARVDLTFPTGDINDLLKSLVLQDAKGRVGTVNYDSSDPLDKILRGFALDLTTNPTFGQILNQARGEKIHLARAGKKDGPATKISGTIVGMESRFRGAGLVPGGEVEFLNLNTAAGLQAIPLEQIVSARFQNASLENEFQRALQVLARSHDTQKKTVSVGFAGEGKRAVRVGYVVERPIWKTTYRLRLEPNGKVFLQGWALVENTSDDDWNDVRMVLVSGKPISFRMNLYDPIYVPRPFVEPALFASLRPPVYSGAMSQEDMKRMVDANAQPFQGGMGGQMMGMGGMGGFMMGGGYMQGGLGGQMQGAQMQGGLGGQMQGGFGMNQFQLQSLYALARDAQEKSAREQSKLTYDQLQLRRAQQLAKQEEARKKGSAIAGFNFKEGIQSVASSDALGDYYQYSIDQKITLQRQKSAMLPILDKTIDGAKISIFNPRVHAKHPLLGLRLKNTSGQPLTQGPITVYDGGVFGGDTRILDVQPNESRLLSYALDQGTEVVSTTQEAPAPDLFLKIGSEQLSAKYSMRQTKTYTIRNRSSRDRQLLVEHAIRPEWKLLEPKKPAEQSRDHYRFQVAIPAGKTVTLAVVEETPRADRLNMPPSYALANGITVKVETSLDFHKLTALKIVKGVALPSYKSRETRTFFVQNLSDLDRTFTVDHIVRPDWMRLDDKGDPHRGPDLFRFKLNAAKGQTAMHSIREERTQQPRGTPVKSLSQSQTREYDSSPVVSADVKAAFTKARVHEAKIAETHRQIGEMEGRLSIVTADHSRVRENLKIIPMSSEHYKKFLEKFVAQDKQIETLHANLRQLNETLETQRREYEQFLAKLDAE